MLLDSESIHTRTKEVELSDKPDQIREPVPKYNVVLIDDNDHTYDYVIEMLTSIFGCTRLKAFDMACEVDYAGRVIVYTSGKEEAEEKKREIISYGPDWRLERSRGSMDAVIEPAS